MIKKIKNPGFWTAGKIIMKNWSTLLCFEMLYRGIGFILFFPFIRYLISLLPGLSGEAYLGQGNFTSLFHHPSAILLLLAILLMAGLYIYFEISALFIYCEYGWQQKHLTVWALWRTAAVKSAGLLSPKRLPVFILLPVMMLSVFSIFSGYLKNIRIPEFIMEFIENSSWLFILFIGVILLFHLILFLYIYGLPCLLFEGKNFRASWRESLLLLKGKKLRMAARLAGFFILFHLAAAVLAIIAILLLVFFINLFYDKADARGQFQLYFALFERIGIMVYGALISAFLCSVILNQFHQQKGERRPEAQKKRHTLKGIIKRSAVIAVTLCVLIIFSETEISGAIFYPEDIPVKIVAHRAGAAFAPENTVSALNRAYEDGAHMAEIDVQQLKDGQLIIMHDTNFKRTTGVHLNVWDADYKTVKKLETGSSFSEAFRGEPVPTLEDMLASAKDKIYLMIELKSTGRETDLEEKTLSLIEQYDMEKQCMIASMNMNILKKVKKLNPDIRTAYISVALLSRQYDLQDIDAYSVESTSLTPDMVIQAHLQGKQVFAWTANSERTMYKILRCHADGIVTDNPKLAEYCIQTVQENPLMDALTDLFFPKTLS